VNKPSSQQKTVTAMLRIRLSEGIKRTGQPE